MPIKVIPCCADYNFFNSNKYTKTTSRKKLKLDKNISVIGYAGSINNAYLIKNMIDFFYNLKKKKIRI